MTGKTGEKRKEDALEDVPEAEHGEAGGAEIGAGGGDARAADAGAQEPPAKKSKKSKKASLRAKYDALEQAANDPEANGGEDTSAPAKVEPGAAKPRADVPVGAAKGDDAADAAEPAKEDDEDDFEDAASSEDDEEGDYFDEDDESEDGGDFEEDLEALSEPEVEEGSRRRRQPVDYNKVLKEMEEEEKAKAGKKA